MLAQKKIWCCKNFGSKKFGPIKFWLKEILGQKKCCVTKRVGSKNVLVHILLGPKNVGSTKNWSQKFDLKKIWNLKQTNYSQNFMGPKKILCSKNVCQNFDLKNIDPKFWSQRGWLKFGRNTLLCNAVGKIWEEWQNDRKLERMKDKLLGFLLLDKYFWIIEILRVLVPNFVLQINCLAFKIPA